MINAYEAAIFSQASYAPEKSKIISLLLLLKNSWERTHFFETTTGLGISVFQNNRERKTVIAFRGTKKITNIISDFEILLGWPIAIEREARNFYIQHQSEYYLDLTFTGHSLGGALAALMSLDNNIPAIIFDSPGCYRTVIQQNKPYVSEHKRLIRSIMGQPNLVNTCDKQLGTILFANTSPAHDAIGSSIDAIQQHQALAVFIVSPPCVAGSLAATQAMDSSLSIYATVYLHKMRHFVMYLDPSAEDALEKLPLPYVKKWCNWLNHLSNPMNILNAIRQKDLSLSPVDIIENPETEPRLVSMSMASRTHAGGTYIPLHESSSFFASSAKQPAEEKRDILPNPPTIPSRTERTQTTLRGIISDKHIISETCWVLALVRKKSTEHAFLLIEGQLDSERKLFRSDLFLAADNRPRVVDALASIDSRNVVQGLWNYSASSGHGRAFIRLAELRGDEYDALLDKKQSEYQSWGIDAAEAEALFQHLIEEASRPCIRYHIAGDHPSWISSASTTYYHNCVSWCQEVIRTVFEERLEVGSRWDNLVKLPSEVIRQVRAAADLSPVKNSGGGLLLNFEEILCQLYYKKNNKMR